MALRSIFHAVASRSDSLSRGRLTNLINSMADGVLAVDKDLHVVVYNGAALNILDRNSSLEGASLADILHPIDNKGHAVDIVQFVHSAKTPIVNRDLRLKYADSSVINLYISIVPVHQGYGSGGQQGYVLLLRDITRERSLEEERDEFISVTSHELRTPIAIAEGNISNAQFIVEKGGNQEGVKQALRAAHDQILFLADLVNDLSMFSRAEHDKLALNVEAIDVHAMLDDLYTSYKDQAAAKGLELRVQPGKALERPLYSGKLYVREVLQNFITNSLKYTEKGSITVTAEGDGKGVVFSIADTGIGISHSDQKRVFEKFFRSEDYRTRKTNGTGLGLYVTAKLVKLLHADLSLESTLDKGSTFTVAVPSLPHPDGPGSRHPATPPHVAANL